MVPSVLIVDDHAGFRSFARKLFEADGFRVLEASDGLEAMTSVASFGPLLVLLDIQMPGLSGFEIARRLADDGRGPVVILTSAHDAADYGERLTSAPVAGFVPKSELSGKALREFLDASA